MRRAPSEPGRKEPRIREGRSSFTPQSMTGGALIVEHDPELQSKLARELTMLGYQVVGASSADGALALMGQWPVDVVVVDEDLPGGGLSLAAKIDSRFADIPVLLITDQDDLESQIVGHHGVIACLQKRTDPKMLRDQIEQKLAERASGLLGHAIGAAE